MDVQMKMQDNGYMDVTTNTQEAPSLSVVDYADKFGTVDDAIDDGYTVVHAAENVTEAYVM